MGKLIELLNEYDEGGNWRKLHWKGLGCEDHDTIGYKDKELTCEQDEIIAYMVSKSYGFIKRLVDNDKIQKEGGICPRKDLVKEIIIEDRETNKPIGYKNAYTEYEQLLMYLAIQDEPLTFLIRILK